MFSCRIAESRSCSLGKAVLLLRLRHTLHLPHHGCTACCPSSLVNIDHCSHGIFVSRVEVVIDSGIECSCVSCRAARLLWPLKAVFLITACPFVGRPLSDIPIWMHVGDKDCFRFHQSMVPFRLAAVNQANATHGNAQVNAHICVM